MSGAAIKQWWVWYDSASATPKGFDTADEALAYQADPKGTPGLGRKSVMRVTFTAPYDVVQKHGVVTIENVWRRDEVVRYPGPETPDETHARLRQESIDIGIALIVSARSKETREKNTLKLLAEQPELTRERVNQLVQELETLKESRKRGPRGSREPRPHA